MGTNAELQGGRKEGRKNDQLSFSVASVEIANGDCPEPLDCIQSLVPFQISVFPFLNSPFSLMFVVCKFRTGNSFHKTLYPLIIEQNHISLLLDTFRISEASVVHSSILYPLGIKALSGIQTKSVVCP